MSFKDFIDATFSDLVIASDPDCYKSIDSEDDDVSDEYNDDDE